MSQHHKINAQILFQLLSNRLRKPIAKERKHVHFLALCCYWTEQIVYGLETGALPIPHYRAPVWCFVLSLVATGPYAIFLEEKKTGLSNFF